MESDNLFFVESDRYGFGYLMAPERYDDILIATERLKTRIQSGATLVRVEVKRTKG
jgi:hypothetical protein